MKKIILIGRSECGKTTLTQALKGEKIHYHKTQYVNRFDVIIDTPGEYIQTKNLGNAIAMYTFEADVVGLLMSSREPYSLYPPCVTPLCNRPVIGIVTQINSDGADPDRAESWLRLAGCETIFRVDSKTGEGVWKIIDYLRLVLYVLMIDVLGLMVFPFYSIPFFVVLLTLGILLREGWSMKENYELKQSNAVEAIDMAAEIVKCITKEEAEKLIKAINDKHSINKKKIK